MAMPFPGLMEAIWRHDSIIDSGIIDATAGREYIILELGGRGHSRQFSNLSLLAHLGLRNLEFIKQQPNKLRMYRGTYEGKPLEIGIYRHGHLEESTHYYRPYTRGSAVTVHGRSTIPLH